MRKVFERISDGAMYLSIVLGTFFAGLNPFQAFAEPGTVVKPSEWTGAAENEFSDGIKNGLKAAQGLAIAFLIFSGVKIVANWGSGSEDGGRDKGALIKWAIAFFLTLVFLALTVWIQTNIGQGE